MARNLLPYFAPHFCHRVPLAQPLHRAAWRASCKICFSRCSDQSGAKWKIVLQSNMTVAGAFISKCVTLSHSILLSCLLCRTGPGHRYHLILLQLQLQGKIRIKIFLFFRAIVLLKEDNKRQFSILHYKSINLLLFTQWVARFTFRFASCCLWKYETVNLSVTAHPYIQQGLNLIK